MGDLRDYTTVACDFDNVPDRLAAHFHDGQAVLPLRVRLGDLKLEHDVLFHLRSKPGYPGYHLLDVAWEPKGGGPYPSFAGVLSVSQDAVGWSRIEIDGTYRPPFGLAGMAFDAAVGQRIAKNTATEFLAEIKRILTSVPVGGPS